jgi:ATP-dependent Lhr-like helicase
MHVLAHQVMALILQEGGISRHRMLPWVEAAYPFSSVRVERFQELVDTMVERGILYEADGLLSLGQRGEKLYGRKNFFELYAVFTAPPIMRVQHGKEDVGHIQALFVSMHDKNAGPLCFRLAGRAWEVGQVDWSKGVLHVKPAEHGRVPSWLGQPGTLSTELCQSMRDVLLQEGLEDGWLTRTAALELKELRGSYADVLEDGNAPLEDQSDGVTWHTFAGGAVNRLLAAGLEAKCGKRWIAGNLSLHCKDLPMTGARDAVRQLPALEWERVAATAARAMARGLISKFQPCLPQDAEDRLLAERLLDLAGTLRFLGAAVIGGVRATSRPVGTRLRDTGMSGPVTLDLRAVPGAVSAASPKNEIQWIDTPQALQRTLDEVIAEQVVGLDVETALDFGTLCLVQIATRTRTYLIDPFAVGDLAPLREVMSATRPQKVIHNARFERRVLAAVEVTLDGVFDTLEASRRIRGPEAIGGHGLAAVCERELGFSLDKGEQTSDWSHRPLGAEQLRYAALDAEVLLALFDRFASDLAIKTSVED